MSVCRQCKTEGCCIPCGDQDFPPKETRAERRARLRAVLATLHTEGVPFLDLCELVELYARDTVKGSIKWTSPRVTVHIKHPKPPKKKVAK